MGNTDKAKLWLLSALVVLSGLFMGLMIVNVLIFLLAEVSLIILMARYRYTSVILSSLLALAVSTLLYNSIAALIYGFLVLLPGLIMGYKARTFNTPRSIILWGFAPYLVPVLALIIYYPQLMNQAPVMAAELQVLVEQSAGQLGISGGELESMPISAQKAVEWMLRLLPGIFFTMFVGFVLFAYLGATMVNKYVGAVIPKMIPLYLWRASEIWLLPLGGSLIFILVGGNGLRAIGENLLVFFVHFYAFFGICFIDYYFKRINIPTPVRIVIYIIMLIAVVIAIPVLAVLGVIDSRFDFRKLRFESED